MGGVFTCLVLSPKHIRIQKLESRNPDNIDKEVFFKFLVISKDIALMGRFLNLKFIFIQRSFDTKFTFKDEQKSLKANFSDLNLTFLLFQVPL